MRRAGHKVNLINIQQWSRQTEECKAICSRADIIHLQRVLVNHTYEHIKYWISRGKAVCPDWDDSYDNILESNAASDFWMHGKVSIKMPGGGKHEHELGQHPIEQFSTGLQLVTAGITPSKILSKDWEQYTPTFVVENYIDSEIYLREKKPPNDKIFIGWGGSLSHTQSWENSGVQDALAQILSEREEVRLFIVGDKRIVDQVPIPRKRIVFHPYVSWWHWPKYLRLYDIGIAPLAGVYDDRRSSLKVLEYTTMGIPFVATKSPVYESFFDVDSGIFVPSGDDKDGYNDRVEAWYTSTIDILDNLEDYVTRGSRNIEIGLKYDADYNVDKVIGIYQEIVELTK